MNTMYYHRRKFLFAPLIIGLMFLFAWITMLLWNALMPEIFSLPEVNYWQAAGLLILARLFFGFGHHRKWNGQRPQMNPELRQKIRNMSPEEKREFFRKMHYNREKWHHDCFSEKEPKTADKKTDE